MSVSCQTYTDSAVLKKRPDSSIDTVWAQPNSEIKRLWEKRYEPDPPAASESWAKPTAGGLARKTLYTFFYDLFIRHVVV
jgi:hypothetical protein